MPRQAGKDALLCISQASRTPSVAFAQGLSSHLACRLGLECRNEVKWLGWRAGQEFGRNLNIKNVSADLLHLSWSTPASKAFVLEYPEPIHLSPGMSYNLKVRHSCMKLVCNACDTLIQCDL